MADATVDIHSGDYFIRIFAKTSYFTSCQGYPVGGAFNMADETKIINADAGPEPRVQMTEEQREAFNEFLDFMVELYRKYAYLYENGGNQQEESVG